LGSVLDALLVVGFRRCTVGRVPREKLLLVWETPQLPRHQWGWSVEAERKGGQGSTSVGSEERENGERGRDRRERENGG
ncbi:unnamed protein product, partial [Citrullus colocynthis]